jgi:Domain of unknown function (DUF2341)/Carbohydrate esterase, sialic acid-specific acetylesterase/Fibronectin type III domain
VIGNTSVPTKQHRARRTHVIVAVAHPSTPHDSQKDAMKPFLFLLVVLFNFLALCPAVDYTAWSSSGSLFINTTAEGANLPASASETNFPLLVRLNGSNFTFAQAQSDGRDLRFAIQGAGSVAQPATVLSYQIEQWDATNRLAAIWVKIPTITGNARQEIKMYWGNAAATSESSGTGVFNAANGYCCVMHLNGNVADSTGSTSPTNDGATSSTAMIGATAMNLAAGNINTTGITNFPSGTNPSSSSQVWIRARQIKTWSMPLAWGNQNAYGWNTWVMQIGFWGSPVILPAPLTCRGPSVVSGSTALAAQQWYHVVYTTSNSPTGTGKIYVNGVLDATASGNSITLTNPQALTLTANGGDIDVDEARISNVVRSADWIKMEYENQKTLQTLVGTLVTAGSTFSATPATMTVNEGVSASFTGQAGGAQKVSWLRVQNGVETVLAVDQFSLTIPASRVTGNQNYTIRFKGIYPTEIKTVDIPVTVSDIIPDPVFTLSAPATWNGRDTITVTPNITNLAAMQAKSVATFTSTWSATGVAVTKAIVPGTLTLLRAQGSGTLTVTLTMDNGGALVTSSKTITVQEPTTDTWAMRTPSATEKAVNNQFYARDNSGTGKLYYNGTLAAGSATSVFLKIYTTDTGTDVIHSSNVLTLGSARTYAFTAPLTAGKITYKAVFGSTASGVDTILDTVTNLVCGDAYIIEGQSNAEAVADNGNETSTSPWIRTYAASGGWGNAVKKGTNWWIGYWGKDLATKLLTTYNMPVCIINGAVGGTRIDQHQANPANHYDTGSTYSIYGNLLTRVAAAKLTHGIRAVLWHQGEQDQGSGGSTGDYAWKAYQQYFVDMSAAWKQDYPNLTHYYIFQIWPAACGDTSTCDQLREVQRTLPSLFSKMRIMSTLGINPGSSCHYPAAGYLQFVTLMSPLLEQDFYGLVPSAPITAADVKKAYYTTAAKNEIALEFGQDMAWNNTSAFLFYLDGVANQVATGSVAGKIIKLQLKAASAASTITYLKGTAWNGDQSMILKGANGLAALTFHGVSILPPGPLAPSTLSATAISTNQINLAWTDNSANETGFKIERATTLAGPYTLITTTTANATTYNNTGLTAGTQYFCRVSATNAIGDSATITANATTLAPDPATNDSSSKSKSCGIGSGLSAIGGLSLMGLMGLMRLSSRRRSS